MLTPEARPYHYSMQDPINRIDPWGLGNEPKAGYPPVTPTPIPVSPQQPVVDGGDDCEDCAALRRMWYLEWQDYVNGPWSTASGLVPNGHIPGPVNMGVPSGGRGGGVNNRHYTSKARTSISSVPNSANNESEGFSFSSFWNSPIMRWFVPDAYDYSITISGILTFGFSTTFSLDIISRGPDFGVWGRVTETGGIGDDVGFSVSAQHVSLLGAPESVTADNVLLGRSLSVNAAGNFEGLEAGAAANVSVNENGPWVIGRGIQAGIGLPYPVTGSLGPSYTWGMPFLKF